MKIDNYRKNHKGTQPIRVLQFNLAERFENISPNFLKYTKKIKETKGLDVGIGYYISNKSICEEIDFHSQTPFVRDKKINIHETFLSYVWGISYSIYVLYEEYFVKPSQIQHGNEKDNVIDWCKIIKAQDLFKYSISLKKIFSEWDKNELPNPEFYDEEDRYYIEQVNGIYVYAMNYILCHEFAHVELGHLDIKKNIENGQRVALEEAADKRAIELIMEGMNGEDKYSRQLGLLVGLCCLLFLNGKITNESHLDTDDRIDLFFENYDDDRFYGIAAVAYKLWFDQFSKSLKLPQEVENCKELYYKIKQEVMKEKFNN